MESRLEFPSEKFERGDDPQFTKKVYRDFSILFGLSMAMVVLILTALCHADTIDRVVSRFIGSIFF